ARDGRSARTPQHGAGVPRWLEVFRDTGNVRLACHAVGINRTTAYHRRESNPRFADAWKQAEEDACDVLEATARKRAQESSDVLLIFLLKAHRPDLYGEKLTIRVLRQLAAEIENLPDGDL